MTRSPRRKLACLAARSGATFCAVALMITAWGAFAPATAAATDAGTAQVIRPIDGTPTAGQPLGDGGSATGFSLNLPTGAACLKDSAAEGYRVQSYMVPASIDPASLTFGANGPLPAGTGTNFRQPLFSTTGSPFVNKQTANADTPGGPGRVVGIPAFSFSVFAPGDITAGTYNIGIACTVGAASATQLDRYWNAQLRFVEAAADQPAGVTWTAVTPAAPTTVNLAASPATAAPPGAAVTFTATITPAAATGTVSFRNGNDAMGDPKTVSNGTAVLSVANLALGDHSVVASFTPATSAYGASTSEPVTYRIASAGSSSSSSTTTTTGAHSTTSTTLTSAATATTSTTAGPEVLAASASSGSDGGGGGEPSLNLLGAPVPDLAVTGSSTTSMVVWALLLLILGRMAVLLGRAPRVCPT